MKGSTLDDSGLDPEPYGDWLQLYNSTVTLFLVVLFELHPPFIVGMWKLTQDQDRRCSSEERWGSQGCRDGFWTPYLYTQHGQQ